MNGFDQKRSQILNMAVPILSILYKEPVFVDLAGSVSHLLAARKKTVFSRPRPSTQIYKQTHKILLVFLNVKPDLPLLSGIKIIVFLASIVKTKKYKIYGQFL